MSGLLSILIPVYNEAENIGNLFCEIDRYVKTLHEIIIVYDFEEDNTLPLVEELMKKQDNIKLVKNRYGKGALNAIKTGFESAGGGFVVVIMADLSDDLSRIDGMFEKTKEGYDIVCGSRYMKGGKQIGGPLFKKTLSRLAGRSLYFFRGIPTHDVTNSFKLYSKEVLNNINIESSGGFELGMEIVIKASLKGYRITEVPSTWQDREGGESKFKLWKWLPHYIHWYLFALSNKRKKR